MDRNTVGYALIALFTIAVIGIAATSIPSTPIQSGFGIDGDAGDDGERTVRNVSRNGSREPPASGGGGSGGLGGGGFDGGDSSDTGTDSVSPLVVLVGLIGIATIGVALVIWATSDDADPRAGSVPAPPEMNDTDDTRPESHPPVELTNDVYRAWWEMARRTDLSRTASRSPSEFAAAAVDAGMNPDAVATLTRLFRAVRYGGASITDDAERQATAALDRIRSGANSSDQESNP